MAFAQTRPKIDEQRIRFEARSFVVRREELTVFRWHRLGAFLVIIILVGWLLYPNDYFLGQMYQGSPERHVSVRLFHDFLSRNPNNKAATIALSKTLESVAQPEKAIEAMKRLYSYRQGDLQVGMRALRLMQNAGQLQAAYRFRWQLYKDLRQRPDIDRHLLERMLYYYYQESILYQYKDDEIAAINALSELSKTPEVYFWDALNFHMAHRNYDEMRAILEKRIAEDPGAKDARIALVDTYLAMKRADTALETLGGYIKHSPDDTHYLEKRLALLVSQKQYRKALGDAKRLVSLRPGSSEDRDNLAYFTLQAGLYDEAVRLYRAEVKRRPKDKRVWMSLIDALEAQKNSK